MEGNFEEKYLPFSKFKKIILKTFSDSYEWQGGVCIEGVDVKIEQGRRVAVIETANELHSLTMISACDTPFIIGQIDHEEGYPLKAKRIYYKPIENGICIIPIID